MSKRTIFKTIPQPTPKQLDRFWSLIDKNCDNGCWKWIGLQSPEGYGILRLKRGLGGQYRAHRISWVVNVGPIPQGLCVLHSCDNPPCCSPDHLFVGTRDDNNRDREKKGKGGRCFGLKNGAYTHPESRPRGKTHGRYLSPHRTAKGEGHGSAKLNNSDVSVIRSSAIGNVETARKYSVAPQTIWKIRNQITWRHLL